MSPYNDRFLLIDGQNIKISYPGAAVAWEFHVRRTVRLGGVGYSGGDQMNSEHDRQVPG